MMGRLGTKLDRVLLSGAGSIAHMIHRPLSFVSF